MKKINKITWSPEQQLAIETVGQNIIVSAGAGSGKTAVLTERILQQVMAGKNISDFILLTFTNLAAFEMRQRIEENITDAISHHKYLAKQMKLLDDKAITMFDDYCLDIIEKYHYKLDSKGNVASTIVNHEQLANQKKLLDDAAITTFDSYCLDLIKKYHYKLGLETNIAIAPSIMITIKKNEIIDEIFNELYAEKNPDFKYLVMNFTDKTDDSLKEAILNVYESVVNAYTNFDNIDTFLKESFFTEEKIQKHVDEYENYIIKLVEIFKDNCEQMATNITGKPSEKFTNHFNFLADIKTFDDITEHFDKFFERVDPPRENAKMTDYEKELRPIINANCTTSRKEIREALLYRNLDEVKKSIILEAKVISDIIAKIYIKLMDYKIETSKFEFSDLNKFAIKLLEKNDDIKNQIKSKTTEIMVDEFQDTSHAQDHFINLIGNNNLYMVGDIKQSIYKFRYAEPEIFIGYYNRYKYKNEGLAIDLNNNFRSRKEVLMPINELFNPIMTIPMGGADYKVEHQLQYGQKKYDLDIRSSIDYTPELITYSTEKVKDTDTEEEKARKEANKVINEAKIAAEKILSLLDKKIIANKEFDLRRTPTFQDFTILTSSRTHFKTYREVFEEYGIPALFHENTELINSDATHALKNLLILIESLNNQSLKHSMSDYSFMSVARSFLIDLPDQLIHDAVVKSKKLDLPVIDNLDNLGVEFNEFSNNLKQIAKQTSLVELLECTFDVFDVYDKIAKTTNVNATMKNLDKLFAVASELSVSGYGLHELNEYFKHATEREIDETDKTEVDMTEDKVNFMTIHASKGLEFNICIFMSLTSSFKNDSAAVMFDRKYGIITKCFQEGKKTSARRILLKQKQKEAEIAERMRLFYVALTRAKQKMILIAPDKEFASEQLVPSTMVDELITQGKYFNLDEPLLEFEQTRQFWNFTDFIYASNAWAKYKHLIEIDFNNKKFEKPARKFEEFDYIDLEDHAEIIHNQQFSQAKIKVLDEETLSAIEFGDKLHHILENINFNVDIETQLTQLNANQIERKVIFGVAKNIFEQINVLNYHPEYEIQVVDDGNEVHGFIDLLIETPDKVIVIDYKTKDINKIEYITQLQGYQRQIEKLTTKPVESYLYSLLNQTLLLVEKP